MKRKKYTEKKRNSTKEKIRISALWWFRFRYPNQRDMRKEEHFKWLIQTWRNYHVCFFTIVLPNPRTRGPGGAAPTGSTPGLVDPVTPAPRFIRSVNPLEWLQRGQPDQLGQLDQLGGMQRKAIVQTKRKSCNRTKGRVVLKRKSWNGKGKLQCEGELKQKKGHATKSVSESSNEKKKL